MKSTGVFGILYGHGELLPYNPAPSSYSYDLESEYSDLVYFINEDENISKLNAEYYYEYYELCINTTGKVEETEDRVYVQTINYEDNYVSNGNSVLLGRIDIITFEEKVQPEYISFYGVRDVVFNNFEYLDTSRITDMSGMFYQCYINNLDLSGFDTSKVTDMSEMFYNARIDDLDVTGFDTSNVTNMSKMFRGFSSFSNIDLSMWNMSKVEDTSSMFEFCDKLEEIILPESLTVIGSCCFNGTSLNDITIPDSVITIGDGAFLSSDCLTDVNISLKSNLKKIGNNVFSHCDKLVNITFPDSLEIIGDYAFGGCDSLNNIYIPVSVRTVGKEIFLWSTTKFIRCGATSQPNGWHSDWEGTTVSVTWGETR